MLSGAFYDIGRVEVLRGPQGPLYGRNATAGVVNIIANRPSTDKFAAAVNAEYGNYDTYRVTTTSTPYDFDMYVTGGESFLAVTPRVSGGFNNATRGNTVMGGLGLSGRTYAFSADAFVEYGQLGVSSAWSTAPTADNPNPRPSVVPGTFRVLEFGK